MTEAEAEAEAEAKAEGGNAVEALLRWAVGPCSSVRLEAFRWAATLALLIYTLAWSLDGREWLTAEGYHLSPSVSLGLQFEVPLLPEWALPIFLVVYIGSMVAILLRVWPTRFVWVTLAGLLYVTMADRLGAFSMNKVAIVALTAIALAPWVEPKAGGQEQSRGLRSAWPIRVLQATLLLLYFGAGICKLQGDWLESSTVLWRQAQTIYMTDLAAWMVRSLPLWVWAVLQHASLGFELAAPLLFGVRRARPLAFLGGAAMHLGIGLLMYRVGYFSLWVLAFYVLFFDEALLERLRERGLF